MKKIIHRYWTEADLATVVEQRAARTSAAVIGVGLDRSRNAIYRVYQRLDAVARASGRYTLRKHSNWLEADIEQLRSYVADGKGNAEIALLTGRTYHAVKRIKYELGVSLAKPVIAKPQVPVIPIFVPAPKPPPKPAGLQEEDEPEYGTHCDLHLQDLRRCRSHWTSITNEQVRRSA